MPPVVDSFVFEFAKAALACTYAELAYEPALTISVALFCAVLYASVAEFETIDIVFDKDITKFDVSCAVLKARFACVLAVAAIFADRLAAAKAPLA